MGILNGAKAQVILLFATLCGFSQAYSKQPLVVGYYESWGIYSPGVHVKDLPLDRLTHIVYQNANLTQDAEVIPGDIYADLQHIYPDDDMSQQGYVGSFGELKDAKQERPELKTLISIGGYVFSSHFKALIASKASREKVAENAIQYMQRYHFDGIDVDWVYGLTSPEERTASDVSNFIALLEDIRLKLRQLSAETSRPYLLSSTIHPEFKFNSVQANQLAQLLDFVSLSNQYIHSVETMIAQHIAPLYGGDKDSVDSRVKELIDLGFPAYKLLMDLPPFAVAWQGVESSGNGLFEEAQEVSRGSWDAPNVGLTGVYGRAHIETLRQTEGYHLFWDDKHKAGHLFNSDRFRGHFISYETERSLSEKIDYVKSQSMAGVAVHRLHSDSKGESSLAESAYLKLYPLYGRWLLFKEFYSNNRLEFQFAAFIFSLLLISALLLRAWFAAGNKRMHQCQQQFDQLRNQLQILEWVAIQLLHIESTEAGLKKYFAIERYGQLNHILKRLLNPVAVLLHNTDLNKSKRPAQWENITGYQVAKNVMLALSGYRHKGIELKVSEKVYDLLFYSDQVYITQLICRLIQLLGCTSDAKVTIEYIGCEDSFKVVSINKIDGVSTAIDREAYLALCELYKISGILNVQIKQVGADLDTFELKIPAVMQQRVLGSEGDSGDLKSLPAFQLNTKSSDGYKLKSKYPIEYMAEVIEPSIMDLNKLIEEACQFFMVDFGHPIKISVYQNNKLLAEYGASDSEAAYSEEDTYRDYDAEFRFDIQSTCKLTEQELRFFTVLVGYIKLLRKTLRVIAKEPVLLADLYELASKKDRISYIKSGQGVSVIYLSSRDQPKCVSLHLKAIKQYFEDDDFLRIHRSYLINPKQVASAVKVDRKRFNLSVGEKQIPIGRSYLSYVRQSYPGWF